MRELRLEDVDNPKAFTAFNVGKYSEDEGAARRALARMIDRLAPHGAHEAPY